MSNDVTTWYMTLIFMNFEQHMHTMASIEAALLESKYPNLLADLALRTYLEYGLQLK